MKIKPLTYSLAAVVALAVGGPSHAGLYSDEMAKCLVSSTTEKDKTDLVRWIFGVAALHPEVAGISSVTADQRTEMSKTAAELFQRLLTASCRQQTVDALKYEGPAAMQLSFQVLGQVAMGALMSDPKVGAGFGEIQRFLDKSKLEELAPGLGK